LSCGPDCSSYVYRLSYAATTATEPRSRSRLIRRLIRTDPNVFSCAHVHTMLWGITKCSSQLLR
jgi:IS5 family transposase